MTMAIDLSGGIDPASEMVLAERPETPEMRDAVNVWLESVDCTMGMRIGVEAVAEQWDAHDVWLDIAFADGRVFSDRKPGRTLPALDESGQPTIRAAGPLRFQCVAPFERWTASYNGEALETSASDLLDGEIDGAAGIQPVEFNVEMTMVVPPWRSGSLLPESAELLGGRQGEFLSPRYEQLFNATGWIRIGDNRQEFTANGLRIRRQGVRKFQGFWGHCWQSAVFPDGRAFGFNIYPPRQDGEPNFNEGFVFDGERVIPARAIEVPWLRKLQTAGDDVSFVLETVDGRRVAVQGETFVNTRSLGHPDLPADFPIVQQAHARYRWDGGETSGMVERSSLPHLVETAGS